MKLLVLSDLHLDFDAHFATNNRIIKNADVVILAGDMCEFHHRIHLKNVIDHIRRVKPSIHMVMVIGNHDLYCTYQEYRTVLSDWTDYLRSSNVHLLNNDYIEIDNVRFIGSTLWTDFNNNNDLTKIIKFKVADFGNILQTPVSYIDANWMINKNQSAVANIGNYKNTSTNASKTVLITHFPPILNSLSPKFSGHYLNDYFLNNKPELLNGIDLAVHGHVHSSFDYVFNGTRVVCNPKGYVNENEEFNPNLIVEV